jgi:YVTN family beta-propeller protein
MRIPILAATAAAAIAVQAATAIAAQAATVLYVTNSEGDDITAIDLASMRAVQTIKVGKQVHGVCAPADGRKLYVTIESEKNLKVLDTSTGNILDTIPLTGRPNECASTPDGRYVGVPIRDGNSVDIVDMTVKKVVKVLPIKVPHNCFNAGSNDNLYVSSMGSDEIDVVDLKRMEYSAKIPTKGIPRPYAVSSDEKTLYVALTDLHGFEIVSIPQRKEIRKVELPPAPPSTCVLEPHTPTHGLTLSPDGSKLWVTSLGDNRMYIYDIAAGKVTAWVKTGACPNWIAFSPDGKYAAVSNSADNSASIYDADTLKEEARVKVGKGPKRVLIVNAPDAP